MKPIKAILRSGFLALAMLAFAVPANAGPLEDGLTAYERENYATALRLFRPLAEQGDANAQYGLGVMYHNGQGVKQDFVQVAKWYRKAAEQGNALAQFNLGVLNGNGQGVKQDYAQAATWFRKAAEQGIADAQVFLGAMYLKGRGVPQNNVEAYKWWTLAADQGFKGSTENRDIVANAMTPDQIAEAQRMAREWMAKHRQ